MQLEPGDVVRVFAVSSRLRNTVEVRGNVWTPGRVGLTPGMSIGDAIRLAGGPKPDVYLGRVLVDRLRPDSARVQLRASLRDSLGTVVGDFPLQEDDVIHLFSVTDFRPQRYVAIGGAVRNAGRYPFRRGMTMRDLVLLAGGLQESAYLTEAEIARLPDERSGSVTATTIRVALDSTYLFERRAGEPYFGPPGIPASANGAPEIELRPYDNVLILQQPSWELQRTVSISGEVKFPGTYALKTRDERLSDVIQRAGGFTDEAYRLAWCSTAPEVPSAASRSMCRGRCAILALRRTWFWLTATRSWSPSGRRS
jgi:protein involved in polysaccharide export with SLBB domain